MQNDLYKAVSLDSVAIQTESSRQETPKKYNPQNTSRQVLKDTFVIRLREYKKVWSAISKSEMKRPQQHFIVQGVRGSGKTTFLTRLAIAVDEDENLNPWLIPIQFKEEEYGISSLFSFCLHIAEELEETPSYAEMFCGLVDDLENIESNDDEEHEEAKIAFRILSHRLQDKGKKLLLLVDNIAEMFENFATLEKAVLREVLSQNAELRIVGGSAKPLEQFFDHKDPFYQFFKVISLEPLSREEVFEQIRTLGKAAGGQTEQKIHQVLEQEAGKVESLRRLTGGVPRTISLLFEVLAEGPHGSTFQYLDETLDLATPIYKHRMDDLTKQQKPIVHAIASSWESISVKEISEKTRIPSKTVSSQLVQLTRQWIVEKVPTDTKNHLYRLEERFFNIWYLMRYGRKRQRNRMLWLTRFLEMWCSAEELEKRASEFIDRGANTQYLPGIMAYSQALMFCDGISYEQKERVARKARSLLAEKGDESSVREMPILNDDDRVRSFAYWFRHRNVEKSLEAFWRIENVDLADGSLRELLEYNSSNSDKTAFYRKFFDKIASRKVNANGFCEMGNIAISTGVWDKWFDYLMTGLELGNGGCFADLISCCIFLKIEKEKIDNAYEVFLSLQNGVRWSNVEAQVALIKGDWEEFTKSLNGAITDVDDDIENAPIFATVLYVALGKGLLNLMIELFKSKKLRALYPIHYYATLWLSNGENGEAKIRSLVGDELFTTTSELVKEINEFKAAVTYYNNAPPEPQVDWLPSL